ncbi:carboxypeptidase regulatory-like domain-containing protein [Caenimonas terrae]|uniref:Carboxypeptidase regulatory-like domain-containing protein n=1 Tax=Caenimonas terrae TaxID=696074 RepID=A0ABW0NH47_9BURK
MKPVSSVCLALVLLATGAAASAQNFSCGGVGVDEQQRIKAEAGSHDLMLTFATSTGAYMADVAVRIQDRRGTSVLEATCDAPIMLVDLPGPGSYRVTATADGASRQSTVTVAHGKRPARATFIWPASGN